MVCQGRRIAFGSPSFFVTMYYIKQVFKINRRYGSCFCILRPLNNHKQRKVHRAKVLYINHF